MGSARRFLYVWRIASVKKSVTVSTIRVRGNTGGHLWRTWNERASHPLSRVLVLLNLKTNYCTSIFHNFRIALSACPTYIYKKESIVDALVYFRENPEALPVVKNGGNCILWTIENSGFINNMSLKVHLFSI